MRINAFQAEGVHGYLKFDITFYPDLTFLIGINGSGKTTALKLILGLTSPSFNYLNRMDYDWCRVICSSENDEQDIKISAIQDKEGNLILEGNFKGEILRSDSIQRFFSSEVQDHFDRDEISMIEQDQRERFEAMSVTKKIRGLTTPKFLGLDRRIYEGKAIDFRFKSRKYPKSLRNSSDVLQDVPAIDSSLREVQELVYDFIRQLPQQQYLISDTFKEKLFGQSFTFQGYNLEQIPSPQNISDKRESVLKAIESLGIKYLDDSINSFFDKMGNITKMHEELTPKEKERNEDRSYSAKYIDILSQWYNNSSQLKRIDDIIKYSEDYQKELIRLRAPLKRLETIVSNFLKEGKKSLHIENDGEIKGDFDKLA